MIDIHMPCSRSNNILSSEDPRNTAVMIRPFFVDNGVHLLPAKHYIATHMRPATLSPESHVDLSFLSNQRLDLAVVALLVFLVSSQSYSLA